MIPINFHKLKKKNNDYNNNDDDDENFPQAKNLNESIFIGSSKREIKNKYYCSIRIFFMKIKFHNLNAIPCDGKQQ